MQACIHPAPHLARRLLLHKDGLALTPALTLYDALLKHALGTGCHPDEVRVDAPVPSHAPASNGHLLATSIWRTRCVRL